MSTVEDRIIKEAIDIVNIIEENILDGISAMNLAGQLGYSERQVRLVFGLAAGEPISRYMRKRYLSYIYNKIGSSAYNSLKKTENVMGCKRYKTKMENTFGKIISEQDLKKPLDAENIRLHLFERKDKKYVDEWLREEICHGKHRVNLKDSDTSLLILDETGKSPYEYDDCYFQYQGWLFSIQTQAIYDNSDNGSVWIMGTEYEICNAETIENICVFRAIKEYLQTGLVKNFKENCHGFQMQILMYKYAETNKIVRIQNLIDSTITCNGRLEEIVLKKDIVVMKDGELFFELESLYNDVDRR